VIVPAEEEITVWLQGEAEGRYSLTIEELSETNEQTLIQEMIGATTTQEMVAEFSCVDGACGEVTVDYDADGELDVRFDWSGNYQELNTDIETVEKNIEDRSGGQSSGTRIGDRNKPSGVVAGATTINQDDELLRMWNLLLEIQVMIDELNVYYNLK
jgi:lysyl-tRNA synthetase class I